MKDLLDRLPPGLRVSKPVVVSAVAVGVSAIVVWQGFGGVMRALISPSIAAEEADPIESLRKDREQDLLETSRARFVGRSMYQLPPPPPARRPKPVEPPKPVTPPPDPGPPPPPATYTGPAPTSVFGDYVIFATLSENDKRIKLGETKAGIKVIEISAPYSVRLGYQRGEYTVAMFGRINESFLRGGIPASSNSGIIEVNGASGANASANSNATTGGAGTGGVVAPAGGRGAPSPGSTPLEGGRPTNAPGGARAPAGSTNPATTPPRTPAPVGPGDEPGADRPRGPGPESDLPSPAMEPVRLPPPNEPDGDGGQAGVEFVDRSLLPPRLSDGQISTMSLAQAREAIAAIDATRSWSVDDHSRARLDHERSQLVTRVNRGN
ncbi:MAG: hypothetical protein ACKO3W_04325 [bacterium]